MAKISLLTIVTASLLLVMGCSNEAHESTVKSYEEFVRIANNYSNSFNYGVKADDRDVARRELQNALSILHELDPYKYKNASPSFCQEVSNWKMAAMELTDVYLLYKTKRNHGITTSQIEELIDERDFAVKQIQLQLRMLKGGKTYEQIQ